MIKNKEKFFDVAVFAFILGLIVLFGFKDATITGRVVGEPAIKSLDLDLTPQSFTLELTDAELTFVGTKLVNLQEDIILIPYQRAEIDSFFGSVTLKDNYYEVEGYVWGISTVDQTREFFSPRKVHVRLYEGALQTSAPTTTTVYLSDNRGSYYLEDFKGVYSFEFQPEPVLSLYGRGLVYS